MIKKMFHVNYWGRASFCGHSGFQRLAYDENDMKDMKDGQGEILG